MNDGSLAERFDQRCLGFARDVLSEFITEKAEKTAAEVGFRWSAVPDAPESYRALWVAYRISIETGTDLPISSEHNEDTIFPSAEDNVRFRFWHDVHHVKLGLSFEVLDELEIAVWHLDQLQDAGLNPGSLPWELFHADLVGQVGLCAHGHRFALHQRRFTDDVIRRGMSRAILTELRRPS